MARSEDVESIEKVDSVVVAAAAAVAAAVGAFDSSMVQVGKDLLRLGVEVEMIAAAEHCLASMGRQLAVQVYLDAVVEVDYLSRDDDGNANVIHDGGVADVLHYRVAFRHLCVARLGHNRRLRVRVHPK